MSVALGNKREGCTINGIDRLSNLPDALIHHVMSFLPMPEVVRTSLLSPRWRNLWTSTPFIHIDYDDFVPDDDMFVDDDKLEKFGDHLLLLRDSTVSVDEARIFNGGGGTGKFYVWIRHAIMHKARLLHVYGYLNLVRLDSTAMPPSKYLKTIRFQGLCGIDRFFRRLNFNYPLLEHLELDGCILRSSTEISSRSLKSLDIFRCNIGKDLLICARNLTHLSILEPGHSPGAIVTRDLSSLVTASISLGSFDFFNGDMIVEHRILDGLSCVATLELTAPLSKLVFTRGLQTCPVFSNLKSLVLGGRCMTADFYPLLCILRQAPKLKELCLKLNMFDREASEAQSGSAPLPSRGAPSGSYARIERIKLYCREDDPMVGPLVQALLPAVIPNGKITIEGC